MKSIIWIIIIVAIIFQVSCGKDDEPTNEPTKSVAETAVETVTSTNPDSIDKDTLDYYKEIAIEYKLNESEFRKVVAKLIDVGATPERVEIGKSNYIDRTYEIYIKELPGEILYLDETNYRPRLRVNIINKGELTSITALGNDISMDVVLYSWQSTRVLDDLYISESMYKAVEKEAEKRFREKYESSEYKFVKLLNRQKMGIGKSEDSENLIFTDQFRFAFSREVYGAPAELHEFSGDVGFDKNGNIVGVKFF